MGRLGGFRSRYLKGPLWSHRDFLKLWTGETISLFGDQFTGLAIPIIAAFIILVHASNEVRIIDFGILGAAGTAPFLLFGLVIGVWVDRNRPRRVMMGADLGRMILVGLVPIAAVLNFLSMPLLYFVAFFHGTLTVFFDVAYQSYVPALVERNQIVDANGKLETTRATASLMGPSLAGLLIPIITAPFAMLFDSLSFLASFLFLGSIRRREVKPERVHGSTMLKEAREGLSVVFRDGRLRMIAGCTATLNFFASAVGNILIPYLQVNLAFTLNDASYLLGFLGLLGGVGALIGAVYTSRITQRLGVGRAIVIAAFISGLTNLGVVIATHSNAALIFGVTQFTGAIMTNLYNINQVSFRQAIVPIRLQGRMNATMRTIVWGTLPIGAIGGTFLAAVIGYYPAIVISGVGGVLSFLWVFFSPVRGLKVIPEPLA